MKEHTFGITALLVGIIALGLAVIPGIALDQPVPFANEQPDEPLSPNPEPSGVTLKFKKWSVTIGGDKKETDHDIPNEDGLKQEDSAVADQQRSIDRDDLLKWCTISAVSCSLIGLILGPISWVREKQPVLAGSAIGICCLALVWQYIVIGIAVGVAIAVLLFVLSQLAA